ncbi:flagellar protein FliS [Qipengyuania sp.]|uniref:flagellar protein FliS n=1 Tax=Qipengyuania sp. TaxID=2004515 RepID=UPI003AF80A94
MLARARPGEAYRESNFDVRLKASGRDDLVLICLDDLIENLGVLQITESRGDRASRSRTLTRCVTALTALEMGIDREAELATSLMQFYGAAKGLLLDSIRAIDLQKITQLRGDLREIAAAFRAAKLAAAAA